MNLTSDAKLAYPGTPSNSIICRPIFGYISRPRKDIAFNFFKVIMHVLEQLLTKFYATTQQIADFRFSTYRIFDLCIDTILKNSACRSNFSRLTSPINLTLGNIIHQYIKQLLTHFQIHTPQIQNFDISTWLDLHASSLSQDLNYKFQIFTFSAEASPAPVPELQIPDTDVQPMRQLIYIS